METMMREGGGKDMTYYVTEIHNCHFKLFILFHPMWFNSSRLLAIRFTRAFSQSAPAATAPSSTGGRALVILSGFGALGAAGYHFRADLMRMLDFTPSSTTEPTTPVESPEAASSMSESPTNKRGTFEDPVVRPDKATAEQQERDEREMIQTQNAVSAFFAEAEKETNYQPSCVIVILCV
jgi:hypothetical protein